MSTDVPLFMPKMSMTMESGELLSWEVEAGAGVRAGDVVAVVQTDKVDMEVESPVDGTIARFTADPGAIVDVGAPIAYITTDSDSLMSGLLDGPDTDTDTDTGAAPADAGDEPDPGDSGARPDRELVASAPSRGGPLPAVPRARRRAAQLRILLTDVAATGPNGVITVGDVERAAQPRPDAAAPSAPPAPSAVEAATPTAAEPAPGEGPGFADALAARRRSIRAAVAKTMTRSAAVPQFTAFADLDLEALQQARGGTSWTTILVRALARALRAHPSVLAGWDEQAGAPAAVPDSCGVALAVDTAVGLLAPVVRDADHAPLAELHSAVRDVIARCRDGKLTMADTQGASTTLSSLGGLGVPAFTSLLTPPQASALSVGTIAPKAVVHNGGLAVRLGVTVGLTVDHRAVDGADAAAVLGELRVLCARPETLLG